MFTDNAFNLFIRSELLFKVRERLPVKYWTGLTDFLLMTHAYDHAAEHAALLVFTVPQTRWFPFIFV